MKNGYAVYEYVEIVGVRSRVEQSDHRCFSAVSKIKGRLYRRKMVAVPPKTLRHLPGIMICREHFVTPLCMLSDII